MTAPPISPLHSPAPNPNQGRAGFNTNKQLWIDSELAFSQSLNDFGEWLDGTAVSIEGFAETTEEYKNSAQSAASAAAGHANFKGMYSTLTGALNIPSSVLYDGKQYILLQNLADVTSVVPGTNPSIWFDYTSSISGGDIVSGVTDSADEKLPNIAWLKYRGIGGQNFLTSPNLDTLDLPSGNYVCDPVTLTGVGATKGTLRVDRVISSQNTMLFQEVDSPYRRFYKVKKAGVNTEWFPVTGGDGEAVSTITDPIIAIAPPSSATEYFVSGSTYAHDFEIDLSLGKNFEGFTTGSNTYMPGGQTIPLGVQGSNAFIQKFNFVNPPDDTTVQYVGYLTWAGFRRGGGGGATTEFNCAVSGWQIRWPGGVAPVLDDTAANSTTSSGTYRPETIQITVYSRIKVIELAYVTITRRV